ncbi:MAG: putative metal-binding motif-containing protein [Flavobacteriales bacterium]|nr:putative metal-binding motif-containing protein [Flavobacteriales bacterium]
MKTKFYLTTILVLTLVSMAKRSNAQFPHTLWDSQFGGTSNESVNEGEVIDQTTDGNFIILANTNSNDGDVSGNHGLQDAWVIKVDQYGNLLWQQCYGGSLNDEANALRATSDGGFVLCGMTKSTNGDLALNNGAYDTWILKADANGNTEWSKTLGGPGDDKFYDIELTLDGGYVTCGYHGIAGGDVTTVYGDEDGWLVKYNADGTLDWKRAFGTSGTDILYNVEACKGGGFAIAGEAESDNGTVNQGHSNDGWLLRTDENGVTLWQTFSNETAFTVFDYLYLDEDIDGSLLTSGTASYSGPGDTYVVTKWDEAGTRQWSYYANEIDKRKIAATSFACNGDIFLAGYLFSQSEPNYDGWIGKLDRLGNELWMRNTEIDADVHSYAQGIYAFGEGNIMIAQSQYLQLRVVLFSEISAEYQTGQITTTPLLPQPICEGSLFDVSFVSTPMNAGNVFTCELSNSSGQFDNPEVLGTLQSQTSGTITCQIPVANNVAGYFVRVVSSNPIVIGSAVGSGIGNSITISNTEVTHFIETIGTVVPSVSVATHETNNGFDMDTYTMSGSATVGSTNPSNNYSGASGAMNVELGSTAGTFFRIDNITTSAIYDLQLSLGVYKSSNNGNETHMSIAYSTDGTNFTPLTYTLSTGAGSNTWQYITCNENFYASSQLSLLFTRNSGNSSFFRVDDIQLTKAGDASISQNGPLAFCSPDNVQLTATDGASYLWSNGETTPTITIDSGIETYYCTITSLNGCTIKSNEITITVGPTLFYADADNDAYGNSAISNMQCEPYGIYQVLVAGDCDDENEELNPANTETCNGVDDDCDGEIDEEFDNDGDGYKTCDGDCNDSNSDIFPGATDVVNGIDDNCDGLVDQAAEFIWYQDSDGDAFGHPFHVSNNATPPVGYVSNYLDCDDTDPTRNPFAEDVCTDNIDNNCDGIVDNCLSPVCLGDLDGNGDVNVGDLLIFTSVFGTSCNN